MSCVLSTTYSSAIATIFLSFFMLPTQIECCSMTTYDIISLMSQNPDYKYDPCYIEWKAAQDAKLTQIWTERDKLEKSMADYNRRRIEQDAKDRESRNRDYAARNVDVINKKKESSVWKVLGILAGAVISICCCVACVAATKNEDSPTRNTTFHGGATPVPLTSVVAASSSSSAHGNQTTNDNNFTDIIVLPLSLRQQPETNVPLMLKRQDSLPSYDDAVRMPSAPPRE